jgi:transposase
MPMKYCDSVRQTVEVCLRAGVTGAQIARELKLNEQWVSKLNVNLHCFGTVSPAHPSVQGRPRQIPFEAEQGILEFIDQNPTCYQDEIVDFLLTEYGISVHRTTVSRVLKKLNQTHKRIERLFPEASDVARAQFRSKMAEYKANQIVFLDESAANERTGDRRMGWSLRGLPCKVVCSNRRSTRWSILPAMGLNGYLDYEIVHGSFTTERFNLFVRQLLSKMNPFPGPRSVLVLDNAKVHHSADLIAMCEEAGVRLEYLPPYSPDFNAIEESFSALKAWMRRNRALVSAFDPFFEGYMHLAVQMTCNAQAARGYFKWASVDVGSDDFDIDYSTL